MSPGSNSSSNDVMTPGTGFPTVTFSPLPHATGSAQYNWAGYAVVASVNGPIEAQRRDELPDEAFIEVHVREAKGPGSPRTRRLEMLLHRAFKQLILTTAHPRTLVQITLQILQSPGSATKSPHQSHSLSPYLSHCLNAGLLALLDGNVPMKSLALAVESSMINPAQKETRGYYVFGYMVNGGMILAEGRSNDDRSDIVEDGPPGFDINEWENAAQNAQRACQYLMDEWLRPFVSKTITQKNAWRSVEV